MFDVEKGKTVDLDKYQTSAEAHAYVRELNRIDAADAGKWLDVGIDPLEKERTGTFIQKDRSVIHCKSHQDGVEMMGISQAAAAHPWLSEYLWKSISPDADAFTKSAKAHPHEGYFIRALPDVKPAHPLQSCLYIAKNGFSQNVHNIVIAEERSHLHVITGCATAPHLDSGLHVGVSEFYVKKGPRSCLP